MLEREIKYRESNALNYSRLKKLKYNSNPQNFLIDTPIESKGITIGSLVDCLLTSKDEFTKDYYVTELEILPSDGIKKIVDELYEQIKDRKEIDVILPINEYANIFKEFDSFKNYQRNYKEETKIKKVVEEGSKYFNDLILCGDRTVVTKDNYNLAIAVADSLKSGNQTSWAFQIDFPDVEMYYQYPIYFTYEGVECKALIDIFAIDRVKKVLNIIDIKTTSGETLDFHFNVRNFDYDWQMGFYFLAATSMTNNPKHEFYGYKIECFFVVESTTNIGNPITFECTKEFINFALNGRPTVELKDENKNYSIIYNKVEGVFDLIEKYKYYSKNGFDGNLRVAKANSFFKLDWYGIVDE